MEKSNTWPVDCLWPNPGKSYYEYDEMTFVTTQELEFNPELRNLEEIIEYVENPNKSKEKPFDLEVFKSKNGRFDRRFWEECFEEEYSKLKIYAEPVFEIETIIGYDFNDENILRQAFTRRSFAKEFNLCASCEELEFIGDRALEYCITKNLIEQFASVDIDSQEAPFKSKYSEGELSKIKSKFVCKEYLAERAKVLGLSKFILYGNNEEATENSREDLIEAIIGAVTIDSNWNYEEIDNVVNKLIDPYFESIDTYLNSDYFEIFNSWQQKNIGGMPDYELFREEDGFHCILRYGIPENNQNIRTGQRIDVWDTTRSKARAKAAEEAVFFIKSKGLWCDLSSINIEPSEEACINQLQELYQKGYIKEPVYSFEDDGELWHCDCLFEAIKGYGKGTTKTQAKKKAAYMALIRFFQSSGRKDLKYCPE